MPCTTETETGGTAALIPVEVTDAETGEIITVYYDEALGLYYADAEGTVVIHPDSIIIHGEVITTEEVPAEAGAEGETEEETEQIENTGISGGANEENDTVNAGTPESQTEAVLEEEPGKEAENEKTDDEALGEDENENEADESETSASAVAANTSSTSPKTGIHAYVVALALGMVAVYVVMIIAFYYQKRGDEHDYR